MGLAASQGRYLCLTARMNDLVYEGQQISQQRLQLAKETQAVTDEYNAAMNNTIMKATIRDNNGEVVQQQLTYDIITNQDPISGLCMRLVDLDGNVVVPSDDKKIVAKSKDESGKEITESFVSAASFINTFMTDLPFEESSKMANWSLDDINKYYKEHYPDSGVETEIKSDLNEKLKKPDEKYLFDENCKDPIYLQNMLQSGQWQLQKIAPDTVNDWQPVMWQGSTNISEEYNTADDTAAQAKYDSAVAMIQRRDKALELRLEQVQTEENAVEKELESVKDVIKQNISQSFKTFA